MDKESRKPCLSIHFFGICCASILSYSLSSYFCMKGIKKEAFFQKLLLRLTLKYLLVDFCRIEMKNDFLLTGDLFARWSKTE